MAVVGGVAAGAGAGGGGGAAAAAAAVADVVVLVNTHLCSRACDAHDVAAVARFAVFSNCHCCCYCCCWWLCCCCCCCCCCCTNTFLFNQTRNVHDVVGPCVVVLVTLTVCVARNLLLVLWQDQCCS